MGPAKGLLRRGAWKAHSCTSHVAILASLTPLPPASLLAKIPQSQAILLLPRGILCSPWSARHDSGWSLRGGGWVYHRALGKGSTADEDRKRLSCPLHSILACGTEAHGDPVPSPR